MDLIKAVCDLARIAAFLKTDTEKLIEDLRWAIEEEKKTAE